MQLKLEQPWAREWAVIKAGSTLGGFSERAQAR
jgi:hypothetical protein